MRSQKFYIGLFATLATIAFAKFQNGEPGHYDANEWEQRFTSKIPGYIDNDVLIIQFLSAKFDPPPPPVKLPKPPKEKKKTKGKDKDSDAVDAAPVAVVEKAPKPEKSPKPPKPPVPTKLTVLVEACKDHMEPTPPMPNPDPKLPPIPQPDHVVSDCRPLAKFGKNPEDLHGEIRVPIAELAGKAAPAPTKKSRRAKKTVAVPVLDHRSHLRITGYVPKFLGLGKKIVAQENVPTSVVEKLLFEQRKHDWSYDGFGDYDLKFSMRIQHKDARAEDLASLKHKVTGDAFYVIDTLSLLPGTFKKGAAGKENGKTMDQLFWYDAGVSEGYTIKEHSARVFEILTANYGCWVDGALEKKLEPSVGSEIRPMMEVLMAFHDIGKGLGYRVDGTTRNQHDWTRPVIEEGFPQLGFSPVATKIAAELTDNDAIGDYLKGHISLPEAIAQLDAKAKAAGLDRADYFRLQMAFYTADAGSYPYLASMVFYEDQKDCCMRVQNANYQALEDAFLKTAAAPGTVAE